MRIISLQGSKIARAVLAQCPWASCRGSLVFRTFWRYSIAVFLSTACLQPLSCYILTLRSKRIPKLSETHCRVTKHSGERSNWLTGHSVGADTDFSAMIPAGANWTISLGPIILYNELLSLLDTWYIYVGARLVSTSVDIWSNLP